MKGRNKFIEARVVIPIDNAAFVKVYGYLI